MRKMKWLPMAILSIGLIYSCGNKETKNETNETGPTVVATVDSVNAYVCPMRCENSGSMEPGQCKVCGMDLVKNPDYKGTAAVESAAPQADTTSDDVKTEESHEGHNH